jgi:hypothetical protein
MLVIVSPKFHTYVSISLVGTERDVWTANDANLRERHERDVSCFAAFALFHAFVFQTVCVLEMLASAACRRRNRW